VLALCLNGYFVFGMASSAVALILWELLRP